MFRQTIYSNHLGTSGTEVNRRPRASLHTTESSSESGRRPRPRSSPNCIDSTASENNSSSPPSQKDSPTSTTLIEEARKMPIGANKTGVLAQQIHDEFLTCKICLEAFTNPKSLNCLHTFCEECIENHANSESSYKKYSDYREFTCPLCRKRTTLPPGGVKKLPDNFLVSSLTEIIDRQKPSKYPFCDICKLVSRKHKEATAKCLDCNKLLCQACVVQHNETKVTKSHNIFDIEIEKDIECKEHSDEVIRFYCETCEIPVCILCTFNDHKEHDIAQFSDAVKQYKENIHNLLRDCKNKLDSFEKQIEVLNACEGYIRSAEQKIKDVSIDMISDIRNREKLLIDEIHNLYGNETLSLIEKKNDMQLDLEGLKSTVNLTELILNGKDMELLLLQKEVQQKLETLGKNALHDLPKSATKVISFVPGMVDMGYIHDQDRPLLSSLRRALTNTSMEDQSDVFSRDDFISTSETQTDSSVFQVSDKFTSTPLKLIEDKTIQTDSLPVAAIMSHQRTSSVDEQDSSERKSRSLHQDDESSSQRRRRRRERERARLSYADSLDENPGNYENQYSSRRDDNNSRRARRYRSYDDD